MSRPGLHVAALALVALAALPAPAVAADLPAYGGELRVALPLPPRISDPARARELPDRWLAAALHEPLLRATPAGPAPGLLEAVPAPLRDGRVFNLSLREGLQFSDGSRLGAPNVVEMFERLLSPALGSPHAWVAVAIQGADEVLAGRAQALAGVRVLSERELQVTLAFPFPAWPAALATLPASLVSGLGHGAGPFRHEGIGEDEHAGRLVANAHHWRGRPYADLLTFTAPDPRAGARALEAGQLDLLVRPEAAAQGGDPGARTLVFAAVNGRRLGAGAAAVRRVLAGLDRAEMVRRFVRAAAVPLEGLLPAGLEPGGTPRPPPPPGPAPARLVVVAPGWQADPRAVAERLQVRLSDASIKAALEPLQPAAYAARVAAGDWDVALLAVPVQSLEPALVAGQVAEALGGPRAALRAERALAGAPPAQLAAAAEALRIELDLWPLFEARHRLAWRPGVRGGPLTGDGGLDPGDLWLAPSTPPAASP